MVQNLKSIAKLILKPKQYAQGQSYDTRIRFHNFFLKIDSKRARERKELVHKINPPKELKPIPDNMGFRKIDDLDPHFTQRVHQAARDLIKGLDLNKLFEQSENKHLVSIRLATDGDPESPFMQLALSPSIVKMVGDYLGMLPVIENIYLWYSPNKENIAKSSQYYHFDAQDVRTVQMFLLIEDVDADSGPFVLLEAQESEKLARAIDYKKSGLTKRVDDELISQYCSADKIHKVIDKAGSMYIVDSDRCFHYGSRKATKPRFMVVVQYFTPYAFSIPFKWWTGLPFAQTPNMNKYNYWQRLVLGSRQ